MEVKNEPLRTGDPYPPEAVFDDRHALLTKRELLALPVAKLALPEEVFAGYTWKFAVKNDKGISRWMIGRYDPLYNREGKCIKCYVIFRELVLVDEETSK